MRSNTHKSIHNLHLVLNYEQTGNYTKFQNCVERCDFPNGEEYLAYNLLQALNLSGSINISWEESGLRWNYNLSNSIESRSRNYPIGSYGRIENPQYFSLIETENGYPLHLTSNLERSNEWGSKYFDKFLDLARLTDQSVKSLGPHSHITEVDAFYSFDDFKWHQCDEIPHTSCFFRVNQDYSGFSYYIFDWASKIVFKVKEFEVAFLTSTFLLNLDLKKIFENVNEDIIVPASYKLPAFISRFLFQNSDRVTFGTKMKFHNVDKEAYLSLVKYLEG